MCLRILKHWSISFNFSSWDKISSETLKTTGEVIYTADVLRKCLESWYPAAVRFSNRHMSPWATRFGIRLFANALDGIVASDLTYAPTQDKKIICVTCIRWCWRSGFLGKGSGLVLLFFLLFFKKVRYFGGDTSCTGKTSLHARRLERWLREEKDA